MSIQGKLHRPWLARNYFLQGLASLDRKKKKEKNSKIDEIEVTTILKIDVFRIMIKGNR